jgi:hypothetical protein
MEYNGYCLLQELAGACWKVKAKFCTITGQGHNLLSSLWSFTLLLCQITAENKLCQNKTSSTNYEGNQTENNIVNLLILEKCNWTKFWDISIQTFLLKVYYISRRSPTYQWSISTRFELKNTVSASCFSYTSYMINPTPPNTFFNGSTPRVLR